MNAIGLYTDCLRELSFEGMLDWCAARGLAAIELGSGNFSTAPHMALAPLVESAPVRAQFLAAIARRGLRLSALNCSGNVLDPDPARRTLSQQVLRDTVRLAALLDVQTVVAMSGCPGEPGDAGRYPNWVTTYWQSEFLRLLAWQWTAVVEPFWRELGQFAADHAVRVALELHPGQVAYNVPTLMRLREAAGGAVGANLDPSHLIWQGMDSVRVVEALGGLVYHVHAKDCRMNAGEIALSGVLETHLGVSRAWEHCLPGDGQPADFWRRFAAALAHAGYAGPLSIEYAGPAADRDAGIGRTIDFLHGVRAHPPAGRGGSNAGAGPAA